jgi:hypothetical protein
MAKDALGHGSNPRNGARQDAIARMKATDERHFPSRTTAERAQAGDLGPAKPFEKPSALGESFNAAQAALARVKIPAAWAAHQNSLMAATTGKKLP